MRSGWRRPRFGQRSATGGHDPVVLNRKGSQTRPLPLIVKENQLRIGIFGLGYVGTVTAACLARNGHTVVGVDVDPIRVATILGGKAPVAEPGLEALIVEGLATGRLSATTDAATALQQTDLSLVCVGTPSTPEGDPDLGVVFSVCTEIARSVASSGREHTLIVRSTVPPGTCARIADLAREEGARLGIGFNPEFLREGSAIRDFHESPYTLVGAADPRVVTAVRELYQGVDSPLIVADMPVAEMVKYVSNAWHATKITFANEIGRIAEGIGVGGAEVMDLICRDTRLNVSAAYLRPGFAYGGSCLPKDLSALTHVARSAGVAVPMLDAVSGSNRHHVERVVEAAMRVEPTVVCVLGLAFKEGTDDLRESPSVHLVEALLDRGVTVRVYDPVLSPAATEGRSDMTMLSQFPHVEALLCETAQAACTGADLMIATHATPEVERILMAQTHCPVIDAARCVLDRSTLPAPAEA